MSDESGPNLSPGNMQFFIAGLAGLAPEEVRKAKILYIKNAIAHYEAAVTQYRSSIWLILLFAIMPFFWPFLYVGWRNLRANLQMEHRCIVNALETWADELTGVDFGFDCEFV